MNAITDIQAALLPSTQETTYCAYRYEDGLPVADLLAVRQGVPMNSALEKASCLLSLLRDPLGDVGMGNPMDPNTAYLLLHALESAKAIIDAVWEGSENGENPA